MRHMLRLVPGACHVGLYASLLQTLHLQILERNTGACNLPAVPKGVQLQAVSNQLPSRSHGGEGPGYHLGHLYREPRGEFIAFSLSSAAGLTMIKLASFHAFVVCHLESFING